MELSGFRLSVPPLGRSAAKGLIARYLVALAASAAALGLTAAAGSAIRPTPIVLLFAGVVLSAWYGGLGPAVVAGIISALGAELLMNSGSFGLIDAEGYLRTGLFLLVSALTGALAESLHAARADAEDAATRILAAASALDLEKGRTEMILQSVSDGIMVQDPSGGVAYANGAAARLLGYPSAEQLMEPPAEERLLGLNPVDEHERPLAMGDLPGMRALRGEEAPERLVRYLAGGSGPPRWALVTARPIRNQAGEIVLAVSALHDLTERVRHERSLEANARVLHELTAKLESTVEQLRVQRATALAARAEAEDNLRGIVMLQGVTAALSEAKTPEEVADVVIRQGMEALKGQAAVLAIFSQVGKPPELLHSAGVPQKALETWRSPGSPELDLMARTAPAGTPPFVGDSVGREGDSAALETLRPSLGPGAIALVPVATSTRTLGALAFGLSSGTITAQERELLVALGRQCAQALDRARLYKAELDARDEAEKASRAKSAFLAVVSHELRTPLNAVFGYEELLASEIAGPLNDLQKQHLVRIRESGRHLLSLIEQILALSPIESGRADVRLEAVDASAVARDAAALMEPLVRRKGLVLDLALPEGPIGVRTDPNKLRQILVNLLMNAVKFTESGAVRVELSQGEGDLSFKVRDTGRGIDAPDRERIFEPFEQVQSEGTLTSGTGLGLPVSRELARRLGGDITVESHPGEGSTFTVRLPAEAAQPGVAEDGPDVPPLRVQTQTLQGR